jgi:FkbM family methyltransferase
LGFRWTLAWLLKEGFLHVLSYIVSRKFVPVAYRVYAPELQTPLLCRYGTSDRSVFNQVFVEQEYAVLNGDPKFVIDCGANVGYTSAYFLERFPNATVLAVEPEGSNFEMLCHNLKSYGDRAQALRYAIWSRDTGLLIVRGQFGDGRQWATQVRECRDDEKPDVNAISVGNLLDRARYERVDILKLDIEGAEAIVFAENYEGWIHRVDTFVIELHDEWCREVFYAALKKSGGAFRFSRSGELTIAERHSPGTTRIERSGFLDD